MEKKIPILMYHSIKRVPRTETMRSLHVTPRRFNFQMNLLKTLGYRGCTVSEAVAALKNGSTEKLVALSFDDGYLNFVHSALHTLTRLKFTATIYAVTGLIGQTNEWDKTSGISENQLMTLDELKQCQQHGMEIGCHSMTHASLVSSKTDCHSEIIDAKQQLEDILGTRCSAFCYPYGHYNSEVIKLVEKAGFNNATTMLRSRATQQDNPMELPRIPITWHTLPHLFLIKILTQYEDNRRNA